MKNIITYAILTITGAVIGALLVWFLKQPKEKIVTEYKVEYRDTCITKVLSQQDSIKIYREVKEGIMKQFKPDTTFEEKNDTITTTFGHKDDNLEVGVFLKHREPLIDRKLSIKLDTPVIVKEIRKIVEVEKPVIKDKVIYRYVTEPEKPKSTLYFGINAGYMWQPGSTVVLEPSVSFKAKNNYIYSLRYTTTTGAGNIDVKELTAGINIPLINFK